MSEETVSNSNQLKMEDEEINKLAGAADSEQLFRLILTISSTKADPFIQWK
ncbi:MAG: hypothetical protein NT007_03315 [Candidatus Kapabacteria bacterium]|nr:hypothetical protein [Candidatus Kapabacteria bacterium]